MDLVTTLTLELNIGFTLEEEARMEDIVNALQESFESMDMKERVTVNTEPEESGRFAAIISVSIPHGMDIIAHHADLKRMVTEMHNTFFRAMHAPPVPERLH